MAARVDHRSLKDRSIDREPQVKRGNRAHAAADGGPAERVRTYHEVNRSNCLRTQARAVRLDDPARVAQRAGRRPSIAAEMGLPWRRKRLAQELRQGMEL